jgi:hypothetical protein
MKNKVEVVKGRIERLKRVVTRTENSMVTFTVNGTPCKAFGKGAEMMTRWMQHDPNSVGEFEGYFDRHSDKFGREFVAAHGKLIETERIDKINSPDIAQSGTIGSGTASAPEPSVPAEPIPATDQIALVTDLAAKAPSNPLPCMTQSPASVPVVDSAPVKQFTFEDLENEYKSLKMNRQMEKENQQIMSA